MAVDRIQRLNEIVRRELATSLYHVGASDGVDRARISFVGVEVARDLRTAVVRVSFLAPRGAHAELLNWLRRHRVDFQGWIARTVQLKYTPRLSFRVTEAIAQGDRVLGLLSELEEDAPQDGAPEQVPSPGPEGSHG